MKIQSLHTFVFFLIGFLLPGAGLAQQEPYPLEYWALRAVISNVNISPDGEHMALLKIANKDANPILEVYDASDLTKDPFRLNADPMEITGYFWVSDNNIIVTLRQQVRDRIDGFNEGVYEGRIALLDIEKEEIKQFNETSPSIEGLLPDEPNKVILSFLPGGERPAGGATAFRPRTYYELNLRNGRKKLIIQGNTALAQVQFDAEGNPVTAVGFDLGPNELVYYFREPGSNDWEIIYRQHEDSFETFNIQGEHPEKKEWLLVLAHNGQDKTAIWEFNPATKQFGDVFYSRSDVDVAGVFTHSNDWAEPDKIVGVSYRKDKIHREFFDEIEAATYAQLEQIIPNSHFISITSRSRDGETLTVRNIGPRDPGSHFLLKDGNFQKVGSAQPLLEAENLADVRYIQYQSRDGKTITGYITIPNGEPPFPLVVVPHGGPFVPEVVMFDEWGQLLANNGYLVLQPQYRGSLKYGLEFYQSAFVDGGKGGFQMQDDKDDGALYLVERGLADPERIAMFGWSYGGYAALVAAAREQQIYQCVIAGAAVTDNTYQVNFYRDNLRGAQEVEQVRFWDDSISPIEVASNVNIPMLLIHGDVDQRVPLVHIRRYRRELEEHDISYQYVELEGADHFSNTLFYHHQITLYESMIGFLVEDCGPGGL